MYDFCAEIAGVPVRIVCRYEKNRDFFGDYFSDGEPLFTAAPTDADLSEMQAEFERTDRKNGREPFRRSAQFLENNAIHGIIARKMLDHSVLLMHGSALCMDGEAYIFTAPSGTGKSTHARLWREAFGDRVRMINDDKPMLKIEEDRVYVCGTPWNGKHRLGENAAAPLKAIVSLNRGEKNVIRPVSRADLFPVIMRQCYGSTDGAAALKILSLEKKLRGLVSTYELFCNMEPEAAVTAYNGMNREVLYEIEK